MYGEDFNVNGTRCQAAIEEKTGASLFLQPWFLRNMFSRSPQVLYLAFFEIERVSYLITASRSRANWRRAISAHCPVESSFR